MRAMERINKETGANYSRFECRNIHLLFWNKSGGVYLLAIEFIACLESGVLCVCWYGCMAIQL